MSMMTDERVQVTLYIPESLRRRMKVAAAKRGETSTAFLERAIEKELDAVEGPQRETDEFLARHDGEGV